MARVKAERCGRASASNTRGKSEQRLLDSFKLDAVDWLGASCGGYLSIRAAAFEPRIKHIISMPTTYSGMDMTLKQVTPGKAQELVSLFKAGDQQRTPSSVFDWCMTQGMHITGTKTPFDFLGAIAQHSIARSETRRLHARKSFVDLPASTPTSRRRNRDVVGA